MSATEIWTFQDAVEHLADFYDAKRSNELLRTMRRSVLRAYRDLSNLHRWSYYDRRYILKTTASQSSSSITFDFTGGSSERMVTLASGSWPDDVEYGKIIIGGVHYEIDTQVSSTVITLSPNSNPGADVAAGTSYTWYREQYPLPTDYKALLHVFDTARDQELEQVDVDRQQQQSIYIFDTPDTPWTATVTATGDYYGALSIVFSPPPSSAVSYDILYTAAPRPLKIDQYNTGTVSVTAGSTTLSSSGASFPEEVEGSIIRFSADGTTLPTGVAGDYNDNDNLYYAQRVIATRTSSSALKLDAAMSDTLTDVKYVISDPLDIETRSMLTALLRMAEFEYAKTRGIKPEDRPSKQDMYEAITMAKEADQRMPNLGSSYGYNPFRRPTITQN